jgi:hypothetical protein
MYLRFLRLMTLIFAVFTLLTWPVLLPIDAAGVADANASDALEKLSWSKYASLARARAGEDAEQRV